MEWSFKVGSNPTEVSKKLQSSFGTVDGLVFNMNKNNSMTFRLRKRILYAWYAKYQNWTVANGKLLKRDTDNNTNVEISFNQHFLIQAIIFLHLFLGLGLLIGIISGINTNSYMYIPMVILLFIGAVLWFSMKRKFKKDVQNFKALISDVLEL